MFNGEKIECVVTLLRQQMPELESGLTVWHVTNFSTRIQPESWLRIRKLEVQGPSKS